jgi:ATP-dependent Clp protease ATP-binding subunit ClpA
LRTPVANQATGKAEPDPQNDKSEINQLRRTIRKEILDPLSIDILEGKVREGQTVHVDARNGALEFRA